MSPRKNARRCRSTRRSPVFLQAVWWVLWIALVTALPVPSRSMEAVDFQQAVERALAKNAFVASAGEEVSAARSGADAARGNLLPSVRFEEKFLRTSVPAEAFALRMNQEKLLASDFLDVGNFNHPAPRNDFLGAITLEQPLFAPKAYYGFVMAKTEAAAKNFDFSRRREDAVFGVISSFLEVATARKFVEAAQRGVSDAKEHLRIAESLEAAGAGLPSDVLRANVAVAAAESGLVAAQSRLEIARRGLGLVMGEPGAPPVDAAGPMPEFPDPAPGSPASAAGERADLRSMSLRAANAGNDVRLRRAGYLPQVGFSAAYQMDAEKNPWSPDNRTWKLGVGLSWDIFDGARREAEIARAASARRKAEAELRGMRDRAAFEATRAELEVREALQRAEIARASLASAQEGVRRVRSRYENHLARMVDLLDAQSALDTARAESIRAENDVRISRARRLYALGGLLSFVQGASEGKERNR